MKGLKAGERRPRPTKAALQVLEMSLGRLRYRVLLPVEPTPALQSKAHQILDELLGKQQKN